MQWSVHSQELWAQLSCLLGSDIVRKGSVKGWTDLGGYEQEVRVEPIWDASGRWGKPKVGKLKVGKCFIFYLSWQTPTYWYWREDRRLPQAEDQPQKGLDNDLYAGVSCQRMLINSVNCTCVESSADTVSLMEVGEHTDYDECPHGRWGEQVPQYNKWQCIEADWCVGY